jgi:hypothetical protein
VDIRIPVNTSVVSCPLYIPQFILVSIVVSCVKFELVPYTCTFYISLNYLLLVRTYVSLVYLGFVLGKYSLSLIPH